MLFFLIGFVVTFIIYLFVRWDPDKVLLGVVIGGIVGIATSWAIWVLERRFPDNRPPGPASR